MKNFGGKKKMKSKEIQIKDHFCEFEVLDEKMNLICCIHCGEEPEMVL